MFAGRRFYFRPVLTGFGLAGLVLLIALGNWQLHRLEWKRELVAKTEARVGAASIPFADALGRAEAGEDMEYTPVRIRGEFSHREHADVFGAYDGAPGVFVFTLLNAEGAAVYVNRGFAPQSRLAQGGNEAPPGAGPVEVAGLFRAAERPTPPASWFRSTAQSADGLWLVRNPQKFAKAAGIDTPPFYIDSFAVSGAEWPKGGTTRLDFNNRHLEYALTWYGLAATLFGVWAVFSLPKPE